MNEFDIRLWPVLGFLPYYIKWQRRRDGKRIIEIRALFWAIIIYQLQDTGYEWTIHVPFIKHIQNYLEVSVRNAKEEKKKDTSIEDFS